jgi:hypothetical protein
MKETTIMFVGNTMFTSNNEIKLEGDWLKALCLILRMRDNRAVDKTVEKFSEVH